MPRPNSNRYSGWGPRFLTTAGTRTKFEYALQVQDEFARRCRARSRHHRKARICCQNDSVLVAPDADTRQALQQAHVSVVSTAARVGACQEPEGQAS
ncbi:hypothetical protein ACCO45_001337 [Purpureocillium lilacinum]|uniref:Uncharacterized protein n=1 Tax=Purpureocillium lilacinum TaxID=33203 RepID=A0ACC4E7M2_PURLI